MVVQNKIRFGRVYTGMAVRFKIILGLDLNANFIIDYIVGNWLCKYSG